MASYYPLEDIHTPTGKGIHRRLHSTRGCLHTAVRYWQEACGVKSGQLKLELLGFLFCIEAAVDEGIDSDGKMALELTVALHLDCNLRVVYGV